MKYFPEGAVSSFVDIKSNNQLFALVSVRKERNYINLKIALILAHPARNLNKDVHCSSLRK